MSAAATAGSADPDRDRDRDCDGLGVEPVGSERGPGSESAASTSPRSHSHSHSHSHVHVLASPGVVAEHEYLDATDQQLLLEDVYEVVDDCRHRQRRSEAARESQRDFGRRMANFMSKLLNELGHLDIADVGEQRRVIRALRRLSTCTPKNQQNP